MPLLATNVVRQAQWVNDQPLFATVVCCRVVLCRVVSCCRCYVNHLWSKPNYRINHAPSTDGLNIQGPFLPRDAMHKRGHCSRPCLSVRLSICLSVTLVDCIHTAEDIVKLLIRPGSSITVVFLTPSAGTQFRGQSFQQGRNIHGGGKILRFSTEIAVYLGNGTI